MKLYRYLNRRFLLRYRIEYLFSLLVVGALRSLSPSLAWRAMRALGRFLWRKGYRRDIVLRNLSVAFPEKSDAWRDETGRRCYEHFSSMIVDVLLQRRMLNHGNIDKRVALKGEALRVVREHGVAGWRQRSTGVIFLTGHIGNWELNCGVFDLLGIPIAPIFRGPQNPWLAEMIKGIRLNSQGKFIERRGAVSAMVDHLGTGGNIGFLFDQEAIHGMPVPFFGKVAPTHKTPAVLTLDHRFPIVFGVCVRRGDFLSYELEGIRLDPPEPTGDVQADRLRVMSDLSRRLEEAIRRDPEQYLWGHRRWKRVGLHGEDLVPEKKR